MSECSWDSVAVATHSKCPYTRERTLNINGGPASGACMHGTAPSLKLLFAGAVLRSTPANAHVCRAQASLFQPYCEGEASRART